MVKKYISRKSEASIALGLLLVLYSKSWIECKKMLTFAAKIIINPKTQNEEILLLISVCGRCAVWSNSPGTSGNRYER